MEGTIHLKSKEGKDFTITKKAAELSELLKGTMNDYPDDNSIPLTDIDEKTTEEVLVYLTHFNGQSPQEIEKPLPSSDLKSLIDEWSFNYIDKFNMDDLVNLTVAANFMGINSLLDLCCAKIASLCKDKSEEEVFKIFNITEDFTDEEREKIRKDNQWIEDNI
jgi:S-phase kinase-associated protein 1